MSSNIVPRNYGSANPYTPDLNRRGRQALETINGNGVVQRQADVEETRTRGNRVDLEAALAVHTMERAVDVVQARRDLAQGDPDIELALLPFQQNAFRKMQQQQNGQFGLFG
jgi:hypothetical protein